MRRSTVALGLTLALALLASPASAQTFGAVLTGSQEVPPTTSPGFGNFTGTFDSTHSNITITLTVANLGAAINGYHIHEKAPGSQSGSIVINFQGLGGTFVNNVLTGTFPVAADVAARMIANPSNFYVNVHTTQFPGGAIRGDLAITSGGVINYAADLRGTNEVPPNASTAFGSAFVTIDTTSNTLYWDVVTSGLSPTLSHIHGQAAAGANAGVLINFATSAAAFTNGRTSGSISLAGLSTDNLNALLTNPGNFYVNVHSAAFPGGEIRGQLVSANEYDIPVAGRVTNGLGQTFVTDLRVFNPSYDTAVTAQVEYFASGNVPNTNATQSIPISRASPVSSSTPVSSATSRRAAAPTLSSSGSTCPPGSSQRSRRSWCTNSASRPSGESVSPVQVMWPGANCRRENGVSVKSSRWRTRSRLLTSSPSSGSSRARTSPATSFGSIIAIARSSSIRPARSPRR